MILYLGTDSNKLLVAKVDDTNGSLIDIVQTIHPVAPNPLGLPGGVFNGVATEWISRHPKYPFVYALTSYWNASEACVTTYRIDSDKDGSLTKIGESTFTGGYQAAHATFSPDSSLYLVAHHNDGKLVIFDCSNDKKPLTEPLLTLETPEMVPGTRRKAQRNNDFPGLPSLHHVQYSSNQKYLFTVDPSQDYIFTYKVNERGLPTTQQPTSSFKCYSDVPVYGLSQSIITKHVLKCRRRARKAMVHPNGKYIYLLYESINRIQVYAITEEGVIDESHCIQDMSTLDPSFTSSRWFPVGMTLQAAAELSISKDGTTMWVSNRGDTMLPGSRGENSIRVFSIQGDGRLLKPMGSLPGITGPVRHFITLDDSNNESNGIQRKEERTKLVAAVYKTNQCLQTYAVGTGNNTPNCSLLGEAKVGANVFCIAR